MIQSNVVPPISLKIPLKEQKDIYIWNPMQIATRNESATHNDFTKQNHVSPNLIWAPFRTQDSLKVTFSRKLTEDLNDVV